MEISIKELAEILQSKKDVSSPMCVVGKGYLFRTVTMIYTGQVVRECESHFVLRKAAWIADTGRFSESLTSCEFSEVEPYPENKDITVCKSGMLDICEIENLPTKVK